MLETNSKLNGSGRNFYYYNAKIGFDFQKAIEHRSIIFVENKEIMKTIFLSLILTIVFGTFMQMEAKPKQQFKLLVNNQKVISGSQITVKFISLIEDSRCPKGTNCIHAGNAKIQIKVSKRGGESKTFELNTNLGPKGETFEGYAINLVNLTPTPRDNIRINRNGYTATFSISRLTR